MAKHIRKTSIKAYCPMEIALNAISGKWKPFIISMLLKGPQRPKDLKNDSEDCTKRVIIQQLRELEEDGIVSKKVYDEVPLRVEYFLTPLGQSLVPVVRELKNWGNAHKQQMGS